MKLKQFTFKRDFLIVLFLLLSTMCSAQMDYTPLSEVLIKTPTENVPFYATKKTRFLDRNYLYSIDNRNNVIPDRLYDNVQLTKYTRAADSPELRGCFFRKFPISGSRNYLVAVAFGGVTDWQTTVLCVITPSGEILSTLELQVSFYTAYVKQFRIVNIKPQICITQIIPTASTSIPFETFTDFTGQRVDIVYSVNSKGEFVRDSEKRYKATTYTRNYLENEDKDLWDGGEIPL